MKTSWPLVSVLLGCSIAIFAQNAMLPSSLPTEYSYTVESQKETLPGKTTVILDKNYVSSLQDLLGITNFYLDPSFNKFILTGHGHLVSQLFHSPSILDTRFSSAIAKQWFSDTILVTKNTTQCHFSRPNHIRNCTQFFTTLCATWKCKTKLEDLPENQYFPTIVDGTLDFAIHPSGQIRVSSRREGFTRLVTELKGQVTKNIEQIRSESTRTTRVKRTLLSSIFNVESYEDAQLTREKIKRISNGHHLLAAAQNLTSDNIRALSDAEKKLALSFRATNALFYKTLNTVTDNQLKEHTEAQLTLLIRSLKGIYTLLRVQKTDIDVLEISTHHLTPQHCGVKVTLVNQSFVIPNTKMPHTLRQTGSCERLLLSIVLSQHAKPKLENLLDLCEDFCGEPVMVNRIIQNSSGILTNFPTTTHVEANCSKNRLSTLVPAGLHYIPVPETCTISVNRTYFLSYATPSRAEAIPDIDDLRPVYLHPPTSPNIDTPTEYLYTGWRPEELTRNPFFHVSYISIAFFAITIVLVCIKVKSVRLAFVNLTSAICKRCSKGAPPPTEDLHVDESNPEQDPEDEYVLTSTHDCRPVLKNRDSSIFGGRSLVCFQKNKIVSYKDLTAKPSADLIRELNEKVELLREEISLNDQGIYRLRNFHFIEGKWKDENGISVVGLPSF